MADDYIPLLPEIPDGLDEDAVRGHADTVNSILDELGARNIELPPEIMQQIDKTRQATNDLLAALDEED